MTQDQILLLVLIIIAICSVSKFSCDHKYLAEPTMDWEVIRHYPYHFTRLTKWRSMKKWVAVFALKLISPGSLPRNGNSTRRQPCGIDIMTRIFRWQVIMSCDSGELVSILFNQSVSTDGRDFYHLSIKVLETHGDQYLSPIILNSPEYFALRGGGIFSPYPRALLAGDVVKILVDRQKEQTMGYYDGHHHQYCVGFFVTCDCRGIIPYIHGNLVGSRNDIDLWHDSDMCKHRNDYLNPGDKILFDGIYEFLGDPFICPISRGHRGAPPLTPLQLELNATHRHSRAVIENVFARMKGLCPIIARPFRRRIQLIDVVFRNVAILTNMITLHQSPIRWVQ